MIPTSIQQLSHRLNFTTLFSGSGTRFYHIILPHFYHNFTTFLPHFYHIFTTFISNFTTFITSVWESHTPAQFYHIFTTFLPQLARIYHNSQHSGNREFTTFLPQRDHCGKIETVWNDYTFQDFPPDIGPWQGQKSGNPLVKPRIGGLAK